MRKSGRILGLRRVLRSELLTSPPAILADTDTAGPRLFLVPIVIFLVSWGLMTHGKPSVTGDGPHYLMVTQSLVADGDLDVANNYAADEGRLFGADGLGPGHFMQATPDGRHLPVHDIGLSILVLPAYRVARAVAPLVPAPVLKRFRMPPGLFVYSVVCLFMLLITCLAWWFVARALREYLSGGMVALVVLVIALAPPLIANGSAVFPEVLALLVVALVVAKCYGREKLPLPMLLFAIGCLPWFHRKFVAVAAGLLVLLVLQNRDDWRRHLGRRSIEVLSLAVLPTALLLVWTYWIWGSLGGPLTEGHVPLSLSTFIIGGPGIFFDREFGVVPWAPAILLLPLAWALAGKRGLPLLVPALLIYVPNAAHDQWWGGWGPVGRFLVPEAPLAALAVALAPVSALPRTLLRFLVCCQVLMTAWVWQHPRVLWNFGDGHNRLLESLPYGHLLQHALPSYPTDPAAWMVGCLWLAATAVGSVVAFRRIKRHSSMRVSG